MVSKRNNVNTDMRTYNSASATLDGEDTSDLEDDVCA